MVGVEVTFNRPTGPRDVQVPSVKVHQHKTPHPANRSMRPGLVETAPGPVLTASPPGTGVGWAAQVPLMAVSWLSLLSGPRKKTSSRPGPLDTTAGSELSVPAAVMACQEPQPSAKV